MFKSQATRLRETLQSMDFDYHCYETVGYKGTYAAVTVNNSVVYAHRYVMSLLLGRELVKGEVVMHKCDNPRCVNPYHLEVSSQSENIKDAYIKKRKTVSSFRRRTKHSPLTESQKLEMVDEARRGMTRKELAERYFVSLTTVCAVCK